MQNVNIVVAGTGYVGLVTGVCLAEIGHNVTCIDVDSDKINKLNNGICPIFEPDLDDLLHNNKVRLTYTTNYENAYKNADVIFICVGTPEKKDGSANMMYVHEVAKQIASTIEKDCLVVVKSTVPIGSNDKVEKLILTNLKENIKVEVASNPEFLSQGTAVKDTMYSSRIVLGVSSKWAENILKQVYDGFKQKYVVTDRRSAELIKYASNDFLALKISYINEIANFCESVGANIIDVAKGMGFDDRIGNKFLNAGIGYGGSCFPKDTKALHWLANMNDCEIKTIKAAIEVNENQKIRLIKKARKFYDDFLGLKIAVLGLTFKPGTDDLREAPSLQNIPVFLEEGATVSAWDPVGIENYKKIYPDQLQYCTKIEDAVKDSDICFIFTEWDEIKNLKPDFFKRNMKQPIILDGRNCYDTTLFLNTGVTYCSIGRRDIIR